MAKTYTLAETEKRIAYALEDAERKEEYAKEKLTSAVRNIAERMAYLADRLEQDETLVVNSLGELQGRGPNLDRLCAGHAMAQDHVKAIKYITGDEGGN